MGLIEQIPRLAVINAGGARTLYDLVEIGGVRWNERPAGHDTKRGIESYYCEDGCLRPQGFDPIANAH